MKIIQLIQKPQLRGAEIFAHQLSKELRERGHQAFIVTVFDANKTTLLNGVDASLKGSQANRLWDWSAWKKLAAIIKKEKPDLIQANAGDTLKYAVFSKLIFRWSTPIVFRNASTISLYIKLPIAKWWNSFLFRFTSHIISVSEFSERDFVETFPETKQKITVIPIGVNVKDNARTEIKPTALNGPHFLHIGGFSFEKNHKGLISIFERLKLKFPYAKLGLIGDGPLKAQIESLVISKKFEDCVTFYGYQQNPEKYLQETQCLLLPSIIEGMPAVVLESFLCKVPVVAYDVGGIPEIVRPNQTGWLVKKNDETGFVQAACEAIENQEKVELFTKTAFEFVRQEFNIKRISDKFLEVYIKILAHTRQGIN